MPITLKGQPLTMGDEWELRRKRRVRDSKRTKYHVMRKDKVPEEYEGIKLVVDGKEMELSDSSKFLLEQLIKDEDTKGE